MQTPYYFPLIDALRIADQLASGEEDGWIYTVEAKPGDNSLAAVRVNDEEGEFVAYWR